MSRSNKDSAHDINDERSRRRRLRDIPGRLAEAEASLLPQLTPEQQNELRPQLQRFLSIQRGENWPAGLQRLYREILGEQTHRICTTQSKCLNKLRWRDFSGLSFKLWSPASFSIWTDFPHRWGTDSVLERAGEPASRGGLAQRTSADLTGADKRRFGASHETDEHQSGEPSGGTSGYSKRIRRSPTSIHGFQHKLPKLCGFHCVTLIRPLIPNAAPLSPFEWIEHICRP
ncbi:hypothetical protein HDZ31DRAFT_75127 [Schizophyllum fasciatum]